MSGKSECWPIAKKIRIRFVTKTYTFDLILPSFFDRLQSRNSHRFSLESKSEIVDRREKKCFRAVTKSITKFSQPKNNLDALRKSW